jgi:hypothetical protein
MTLKPSQIKVAADGKRLQPSLFSPTNNSKGGGRYNEGNKLEIKLFTIN